MSAIAISGDTATAENIQEIVDLKHRVVVVNPEVAFKDGGVFGRVWKDQAFTSKIISVIWDEGHCVNRATVKIIRRSNDRPNIYLTVRKIRHSLASFRDLDFLIPSGWKAGDHLPKFLVFFDDIKESIRAAKALKSRLPLQEQSKIKWFNSDDTPELREYLTEVFREQGEEGKTVYGLYCTDSFGMGIDIADIEIVVQWRMTCDLNTLWQRFGRAARGMGSIGIAILLVEAKFFDDEKVKAAERMAKRAEKASEKVAEKEKRKRKRGGDTEESRKRARTSREGTQENTDPTVEEPVEEAVLSIEEPVEEAVLSTCEQLRVEYRARTVTVQSARLLRARPQKKGPKPEDLAPELDNLINADCRSFRCFRVPIMAYYENDRVEPDHQQCLTDSPSGCRRCCVPPSPVCCSLCHPDDPSFARYPVAAPPAGRAAVPRQSRIPALGPMTLHDFSFRRELDSFRRRITLQKFSRAHLNNLGPGTIMGDTILERIVTCARAHKLDSVESLQRETKWGRSVELGPQVLDLVQR
ncbi:hypothetical protein NLI96_g11327 [Meripilus lineatus]|uniref:DNA 3'-5' helicase n=1 Tax=Meripilus lineatus TaxID=2056292 RepID=A0AAD5UUD7_9APHY|nr:hypothetical protein NLI96_g11327 [Physisporinus lineatus]